MQGSFWVQLIRRIPEAQHDNLIAVTTTGAEIMVLRIIRLEDEFVILRGRPAGSTDDPRVLLLPYDQLNHLAFNKPLPETQIVAMFDGTMGSVPPVTAVGRPAVEDAPTPQPGSLETKMIGESTPAKAPESPAPGAARPPLPSKSVLLARLRARLNSSDASRNLGNKSA
jgi:hypothetical protein